MSGGTCTGNILHFAPDNPNLSSYDWSFGDGGTSSAATPAHQYNTAGNYTVSLVATDNLGCVTTGTSQTITINPPPVPQNITASDTLLCMGETATLTAPLGESYLWSTGSSSQSITVNAANNYTVKVTLANGCYYTTPPQPIQVILPPDATIYPAGDTVHFCTNNGAIFLHVQANDNYSYQWTSPSNTSPQQQVYYNSTHSVTVTDNATGCTASDNVVMVGHYISTPTIAVDALSVCEGNSAQLWVSSVQPNIDHYVWTNGVEDSLISVATSGSYGVYSVDNWGCISDTSVIADITINALPNVALFPAGCYEMCLGDTLSFPDNTAENYQWYFNDTLIANNTGSLVPLLEGDYYVVMTNENGCTATTGILSLQFKTNCPTETTLPINLIDFSGTVKETGNLLQWTSASETNCDHYTLYHSTDGKDFRPINTTQGAGNSTVTRHYQYLHPTQAELSYYRLDETDYDGTSTPLGTVVLRRAAHDLPAVAVYPNPAQTVLQVSYYATEADAAVLKVYDITGKLLYLQNETAQANTENAYQITVADYPTGIYWLQIGEQVVKWVKN